MAVKVRERPKGSGDWWIFIDYKNKRKAKKIGKDRRLAKEAAKKIEAKLVLGDIGIMEERLPRLKNYGQSYVDSPLHKWAPGTRDNYQSCFKHHVKPALGRKRLDQIGRVEVKNFIGKLKEKGLSGGRIEYIMLTLSSILNNAIDDGLISSNPCARTRKYYDRRKKSINPLSASEAEDLLGKTYTELSNLFYTLFLLLIRSGIRIGEALALEWDDIDFKMRTAKITKNWDYIRHLIGPPKNNKPREVYLTPMVVKALKKIKAERKIITLGESQPIFIDSQGNRLKHKPIYRALHKIAPRKIRIHDLRHTYATLRVAKGDNIVDVWNQLGHHNPDFTLKEYAHWMPGEHKAQVDELDELATSRNLSATYESS